MHRLNGDVGCGAESAIGVIRGAVGVSVRDLHRAQGGDQKDAEQREEDSPGMVGAMSPVCVTHIRQFYERSREPICDARRRAWFQRAS